MQQEALWNCANSSIHHMSESVESLQGENNELDGTDERSIATATYAWTF